MAQKKNVSKPSRQTKTLKTRTKFNWKIYVPVIIAVAALGGMFVYLSLASGVGSCRPGTGVGGKGKYLFGACRISNNEPTLIQDSCKLQFALNPGPLGGRNLPYEDIVKDAIAETTKYSGIPSEYLGKTSYTEKTIPENKKHIVLIQLYTDNQIIGHSGNTTSVAAMNSVPRAHDGATALRGGVVKVDTKKMESRPPAGQVSSIQKGPFSSSDIRSRLYPVISHELGHVYGLKDLYKNGNSQNVIDTTQKMGSTARPWGSGDIAGLAASGRVSKDLSKCFMPSNSGVVSDASARQAVEAAYATVLGRKPDESGGRYWENSLKLGKIKKEVLPTRLLNSAEGKKIFSNSQNLNARISQMYKNSLCRAASSVEVASWVKDNGPNFNRISLDIGSSTAAKAKRASIAEGKKICR